MIEMCARKGSEPFFLCCCEKSGGQGRDGEGSVGLGNGEVEKLEWIE